MDNITPDSIIAAATQYGWTQTEPTAPFTWIIDTYLQVVREGRENHELFNYYVECIQYLNAIHVLMVESQVYVEVTQNGRLQ